MSAYAEFLLEKRSLDALLADGYAIAGVTEGLDGMAVRFKKTPAGEECGRSEVVRIRNADARKYVGTLLFAGQREASASGEAG